MIQLVYSLTNKTMRRLYLIFLALLMIIIEAKANAQEAIPIKPFEFEISLGGTWGLDKYVGNKKMGPAFALEGRYNFYNHPVDVGLEIYGGSTARKYANADLSNRILSLSVFSDYNFRRGKKCAPYIGAGIGLASYKVVQGDYGTDAVNVIFTPRLGMEMFHHFRITAYSRLGYKGYNNLGVSFGCVFGGGKRK